LTRKRLGVWLGNVTWIALASVGRRTEAIGLLAVISTGGQALLGGGIHRVSWVALAIIGQNANAIGTTLWTLGHTVSGLVVQFVTVGTNTAARRLASSSTTALAFRHTTERFKDYKKFLLAKHMYK